MSEKLHNFQFPNELKWSWRTTTTGSPAPLHHSTLKHVVPERAQVPHTLSLAQEEALGRLACMESQLDGNEVKKYGLVIKLQVKSNVESREVVECMAKSVEKLDGKPLEKENKVIDFIDRIPEATVKSWNLSSRTNKSLNTSMCLNGSKASGNIKSQSATKNARYIREKKALGIGGGGENAKLTIDPTLTQREIDEDYLSFGLKTPRRPKKIPQKLLNMIDRLVPGNNLVNISEETYYVSARSIDRNIGRCRSWTDVYAFSNI